MVFVEQAALDNGRTSLAWLMTGLPEPNYGLVSSTPARSSVKPFSRLASPTWVAANIGYLKDLDFLENPIRSNDRDSRPKWGARRRWGKKDSRRQCSNLSAAKGASAAGRRASKGGEPVSRLPRSSCTARGTFCPSVDCGRRAAGSAAQATRPASARQTREQVPLRASARAVLAPDANIPGDVVPTEIRCIELTRAILQVAGSSKTGFGTFWQRSLLSARTVHEPRGGSDLWPCPPPRWSWTGPSKPSPSRRRRKKFFETRAQLLQTVVVALNWLCLGNPLSPPKEARLGFGISPAQHDMLEHLEDLLTYFLLTPTSSFEELGRAAEKMANLCKLSFKICSVDEVSQRDISSF